MVVTDLRTVSFDVPKQEVLTKDSVTVNVDAVVYYNIYSPLDATCKVEWGYKECAHTGKFARMLPMTATINTMSVHHWQHSCNLSTM